MKKIVSVIIISISLFFGIPVFASHQFSDVPEFGDRFDLDSTYYNHELLDYLGERNIISGYAYGTFRPMNDIKRVEVLRMLLDAAGIGLENVSSTETAGFPDTIAGQWYVKYVKTAKTRGIIAGYGDGTFRPINTIKLGEALKILFLANGITVFELPSTVTIIATDVSSSDWFAKYVFLAMQKGIIQAVGAGGKVEPGRNLTRAQFAQLAFRLRFILDQDLEIFTEPKWAEYEAKKLYSRLKSEGMDFSNGPCISNKIIPNWVADIVHTPRTAVDNDRSNQCSAYRGGIAPHFIELDTNGNLVQYFYAPESMMYEQSPPAEPLPDIWEIMIQNFQFSRPNLTIKKGDTVKFVNLDMTQHQIATDPHPMHTNLPAFQGPALNMHDIYQFTFNQTGTFSYHCHLHPSMRGTITVMEVVE